MCFAVDGCLGWFGGILRDRRRKTVWEQNDLERGPKLMHGCHDNSILDREGTTKIRNGHFLAKWGKMGMFLAKWGQNGQFLGEMAMFHIAIANNPHANTSLTVSGSVFPRTQNDPDLRLKKMFKYVVSARFLVSFKILWSPKRCLDDK